VRRSHIVGNIEALNAEHALFALGEVVHGGAAHPADADDDRVKVLRATYYGT
jgi:hypothetical protein